MQRDLVEVLAWPLNGAAPQPVRELPQPPRPRRGPAPPGPELPSTDRTRFFQQMRRTAEHARSDGQLSRLRRMVGWILEDAHGVEVTTFNWLVHARPMLTQREAAAGRPAICPARSRIRSAGG
ncbi:hypothetical protein [Streptomyces sp. NPDC053726]|uniref:hypothetical protein n=1 Tax=Streptomyces sp. NPDC053726 TaxID=3365713 RepID=UPI0037CFFBE0